MTKKIRNRNLEKNYSPDSIEQKWYAKWLENGLFNAEINPEAKAFSIVIPPPNVTGSLHVGHAFDHTFQDIMCRTQEQRLKTSLRKIQQKKESRAMTQAEKNLSKKFGNGENFTALELSNK